MHASAAGLLIAEPAGQGWPQVIELALAFVLSSLIGLEREWRNKSAGLRTHALVGVGSALFMLVSKYGFGDVLASGQVVLDPSRMAAQIVSGIGFIGGGLIFVRRDAVRGLTTAAVVWVVAAVGAAAGAGLPILAALVTAGHFLVVFGLTPIARQLPRPGATGYQLRLAYRDGSGALRRALDVCASQGFTVTDVASQRPAVGTESVPAGEVGRDGPRDRDSGEETAGTATVSVALMVRGDGSGAQLAAHLTDLAGVVAVSGGEATDSTSE